jgi:predicted ABC-type ATPase
LKNVRVDEDYIQGILKQSGGKLKGDYYIVAPETCVRLGETVLKNPRGDKVTFKMLTFPYKVLEEVARNFSIEEQPSAPENINKLISSVGFYFNEAVDMAVKKTAKGFKITKFSTSLIASGLAPFSPEGAVVKAGKLMLEEIDKYRRRRSDFAFETTLSGRTYLKLFEDMKKDGYAIHLFFLWLQSPELALGRVKERVNMGGHDVPVQTILRRFERGFIIFFIYIAHCLIPGYFSTIPVKSP